MSLMAEASSKNRENCGRLPQRGAAIATENQIGWNGHTRIRRKQRVAQVCVTGAAKALISNVVNCNSARRRGGRVAECGGLLNRCTG
jgi:hypothetical protein